MSWKISNSTEQTRLEKLFASHGIDFTNPGFYDLPAFMKAERADHRFLENYARYVEARSYTDEYLEAAKGRVEVTASVLEAIVAEDGRKGACVDVSGMLGRMLDELGVWNYVAKSTLTAEFPASSGLGPSYFWAVDFGNFVAPHAIVVAPPFAVVDLTAKHQSYHANQAKYLSSPILAEEWVPATWKPEDIANVAVLNDLRTRGIAFNGFLERHYGAMLERMGVFPARAVSLTDAQLKYVIIAVGATDEPLKGITGYKPCGRTALEIFEKDVMPQLA